MIYFDEDKYIQSGSYHPAFLTFYMLGHSIYDKASDYIESVFLNYNGNCE